MSRDHAVSVRLTDSEREQLAQRAERQGRSVSDLLRDHLFAPLPTPIAPARSESVTAPAGRSNLIWLTPGHVDGHTLTVAA